MAKAEESSRFVSVGCSLDVFVQHQENKNTLSKTQRDVSLLKKVLVTVKPKMFAVVGSERDPVRAYDLYASKRPDNLKTPDSPFYLAISHTRKAVNTKPWFKSAPIGVNKIKSLMKTMADLEKAGLDAKNLTNHSGRKRMIQKLNDEGVPPTHIMQRIIIIITIIIIIKTIYNYNKNLPKILCS